MSKVANLATSVVLQSGVQANGSLHALDSPRRVNRHEQPAALDGAEVGLVLDLMCFDVGPLPVAGTRRRDMGEPEQETGTQVPR